MVCSYLMLPVIFWCVFLKFWILVLSLFGFKNPNLHLKFYANLSLIVNVIAQFCVLTLYKKTTQTVDQSIDWLIKLAIGPFSSVLDVYPINEAG